MTHRLPIRIRLTLWYGLLLTATLALLAALLYGGLRWRLSSAFDDQLAGQAQLVLATLALDQGELEPELGAVGGEEEFFVRILDRNGRIVAEQGYGEAEVPLDRDEVGRVLDGARAYRDVTVGPDAHLRLLSVPIRAGEDGATLGVLQVALDRGDIDDTLAELLVALLFLIPVAVAIALAGGYILAGQALRPLARITAMARDLGEHDLHERLNLDLPDDELGRLATTLDGMLGRIEEAFERQKRFTGDAAHELRTPLSLMRSQVDLALSRDRSAMEYRQALESLDADLSRATNLTTALLSLARLENAAVAPVAAPFDLAGTIASTIAQYAPVAAASGIDLRQDGSPHRVMADEDMVIQVLANLVENAIAHTPVGGAITVANRARDDFAWVTVTDTGGGIPEPDQARVFDRFYRPDAGRTRARGGVGLGLAICQAIVQAHGGTISLRSTPGAGTTVEFTLPPAP